MQAPTNEIKTPVGGHSVVIKQWITGRDREYISEPLYESVQAKQFSGAKAPDVNINVASFIKKSGHREIETFVVSVNGSSEKVLESVLNMHEEDYEFVKKAIEDVSKKKGTQTTS